MSNHPWLSEVHFRSVYRVTMVASPERIFASIREMRPGPVARVLFTLRALPARLLGGKRYVRVAPDRPIIQQALDQGFFILKETPPTELIVGVAGHFWRPSSGIVPHKNIEAMTPKAQLLWRVEPRGDGHSVVSIITEVQVPRKRERFVFACYWALIYVGGGLIRREILRTLVAQSQK